MTPSNPRTPNMTDEKVKEAVEAIRAAIAQADRVESISASIPLAALRTLIADHAALQAERDKLAAENAQWEKQARDETERAAGLEAKLTALVEALQSADYAFTHGMFNHRADNAREIIRQALAHHSAPVGEAAIIPDFLKRQTGELPPATFPAWRDDSDGREGRREGAEEDPDPAPPSIPTSAPVEDEDEGITRLEDDPQVQEALRFIEARAFVLATRKHGDPTPVKELIAQRLAALSPALIQPQGEERS